VLVELAIGDAYGAGFEYVSPAHVQAGNDLSGYVQHPRHQIAPGCYTDDTQMTLAIAEALVEDDPWTAQSLADRFVGVFKRDERVGYSSRFHALLTEVGGGTELLALIDPRSTKSGAAMRAAPIGLCPTVDEVLQRATGQARVTHDTPEAVAAACAAALMTHYCHHGLGLLRDLPGYLHELLGGDWPTPWQGKVGAAGMDSTRAALTALSRAVTLQGLLHDCVAFTGDVDTVATIALAAAACTPTQVEPDLPDHLYATLEDGPYGRHYLQTLDLRLLTWATERTRMGGGC
jgi:ADP-ribosyl-[dinitrogen reductase] hydrolase